MIVVTAPTSTIGRQLVARLLEHDEPVRVIVRDPSKLTDAVRERVEVVVGSHRDRGVLDAALPGADALFWLMPADHSAPDIFETYVTASIPGAEAVHRHGVERVVIVSALGRGSGLYAGHVSASLAMEDLFRSTGVHVRALANPSFMDNVLRQLPSLRAGVLTGTHPADLALPAVATRDIAEVADRLLRDRAWVGQDTVDLLGAADISLSEMAATLSEVLGTPIRYECGSRDETKNTLIGYGFSDAVAQAMIDMDAAKENGLDLVVPRTPANTTPTTFSQFAEEVVKPAFAG